MPSRQTTGSRALSLLCAASLLLQPVATGAVAVPFPDMEHSWYGYSESVAYLVKKGSINGYPDGLFHPQEIVNRAEFLKLLFRSRGTVSPAVGDCFPDVHADDWFAPYVCAAKNRGIVSGYTVGSRMIFKPAQPIIFAEAVKMAVLAYGSEIPEGAGEQWYAPYVAELDRLNVLRSSSYIPWTPITRERAADLIARFVRSLDDRMLPNLSAGCGKAPAEASRLVTVNGLERTYLLDKPASVSSNTPSPLIVAFHGRTNSNDQVRAYFGFDKAATDYFVAYPAGIPTGNGSYSWSDPGDKPDALRDIALFDAIVKQLGDSYCIDLDRIYVTGHSLGAWFANTVACVRGGVIRASATVGGSTTVHHCTGPTAAMILNNPNDTLSSQKTAESMRDIRIAANTCSFTSSKAEPSSLSCVQYADCPLNPVLFCPHTIDVDYKGNYYPHVWPDGTAQAMVRFFDGLSGFIP
ncbi:MAG: S-layer homology domain-containing protein [Candidatus Peribacteraceae bacterium]|nr:S-layer homology domain-containing protein [Candidatus Peribacteraceae bacterium]MDD5743001.1 S-layer homology domain-containing protein [Candidatus Peribacteraceae bacterium]